MTDRPIYKNNPNLNQVLGTDIELFKHCFVQKSRLGSGHHNILICVEPYDRDLTQKDGDKIYKLIKEDHKARLIEIYQVIDIDLEFYI